MAGFVMPVMGYYEAEVSISVRPKHRMPPSAISTFSATSVTDLSEADLNWIAPETHWNVDLERYYITYATFGVHEIPFLGNTTTWWDSAIFYDANYGYKTKPGDNLNWTIKNINPELNYYFAIKAVDEFGNLSPIDEKITGGNQVCVIRTLMAPTITGVAVSTESIRWSWNDVANETGYRVKTSTGGLLVSLLANTTYWFETGLSVNTAYSRYIEAYNEGRASSSATVVKYTLANPPTSSVIISVTSASISVAWDANGNPSWTRWGILRSTDNFSISTNVVTNFDTNWTNTSYTDSGLAEFTTYFYKVQAFNEERIATTYDIIISTRTEDTIPPTVFNLISPADYSWQNTNSVNFQWQASADTGSGLAKYQLWIDSLLKEDNISASQTSTTTFVTTGDHIWYVKAIDNVNNVRQSNQTWTVKIDTIPPTNVGCLSPANNSVNVSATTVLTVLTATDTVSGLSATPYYIELAVNADFTGSVQTSGWQKETSWSPVLTSETTYYWRVKAKDAIGNESSFCGDVDTVGYWKFVTVPNPPTAPTFTGVAVSTESIRWSWDDVANETGYRLRNSTGGVVVPDLLANITSYLETSLLPNYPYTRYVEAYNVTGTSSSIPATKYTLALPPTDLSISTKSAHTVTLNWQGNGGTRFRIDLSTDNADWRIYREWSDNVTTETYKVVELPPATTYYFAVWGYNGDGIITTSSATASSVTENIDSPIITPGYELTRATETRPGVGLIEIDFLKGAVTTWSYIVITPIDLSSDSVKNTREVKPEKILDANEKMKPFLAPNEELLVDAITEINLYDYRSGSLIHEKFGEDKEVYLTLPYPDADNDGYVDNTDPPVYEGTLKIYVLNEETSEWELIKGEITIDRINNLAKVRIRHLSVYALIGKAVKKNLREVRIYPNPWKPGSGDKYDTPVGEEGLVFEYLTQKAKIQIFNIAGELVREYDETTGAGRYVWPGTSDSGEKVASGIYIYIITNLDDSSDKARGRVAIIR
jgi:hypothetical protein